MKKLFLAFTAFVGMLTGLSLTSCGGGGGGGNLAGTVLYMTSNGYKIIFNEQVEGIANSYVADITDPAEDHFTRAILTFSNVTMDNGKLSSATGSFASECFDDPDYPRVLVWMFGTQGETAVESVTVGEGSKFTLTATDDGGVTIVWEFTSRPYWIDGDGQKNALIPPSSEENNTTTEGGNDDDQDDDDEVNGGKTATHTGYILRY